MTFHDTAMSKVVENGEWLSFYDQLNTKLTANFEYEVGGYVAYTLVNFHRFFAGSVRQKIEYPRKDYEVRRLLVRQQFTVVAQKLARADVW